MTAGAVSRRRLLVGGAATLGALAAGAAAPARAESLDLSGTTPTTGFGVPSAVGAATELAHGTHQAGIETRLQSAAAFVGLDLAPGVTIAALASLWKVWSDDITRLTDGRPALADPAPELASPPARLTVTLGLGPGIRRVPGLRAAEFPDWVAPLPRFGTDHLDDHWRQPDVLLQVCADDPVTVAHACQVLEGDATGVAAVTWTQHGFHRAAGTVPTGQTGRNLMGYVDGTVNVAPGTADFDEVVWADDGPAWLRGGTGMVLRRIRMDLARWASVDRPSREHLMGRRMDGSPLTGRRESDVPDLAHTTGGLLTIPEFAHIRRARARDDTERMVRRPYNYRVDGTDTGLLFAAFMADPRRQFVPVQRRLAALDALNRWTTTVGSAVFAILPGFEAGGWLGQSLLDG